MKLLPIMVIATSILPAALGDMPGERCGSRGKYTCSKRNNNILTCDGTNFWRVSANCGGCRCIQGARMANPFCDCRDIVWVWIYSLSVILDQFLTSKVTLQRKISLEGLWIVCDIIVKVVNEIYIQYRIIILNAKQSKGYYRCLVVAGVLEAGLGEELLLD